MTSANIAIPILPSGTIIGVSDAALEEAVQEKVHKNTIEKLLKAAQKVRNANGPNPPTAGKLNEAMNKILAPKSVIRVPELHTESDWVVNVGDLLLRLGLALSPAMNSQATHPASAYWPILKYLNFFKVSDGCLHGGPMASRYVEHGRTAVSDELGVAFSLMAGERWLEKSLGYAVYDFVDVEQVLNSYTTNPAISQPEGTRRRPDWLIMGRSNNSPSRVEAFALESKGTSQGSQDPNRSHVTPLASGVEQLAGIEVEGRAPKGLATLTISGEGPIVVKAVDPGLDPYIAEISDENFQEVLEHQEVKPFRSKKSALESLGQAELAIATQLEAFKNLAHLAQDSLALAKLGATSNVGRDQQRRLTKIGPALGNSIHTRDASGSEVSIFMGVTEKLVSDMRDSRWRQALDTQRDVALQSKEYSQEISEDRGNAPSRNGRYEEYYTQSGAVLTISIND